MAVICLHLEGHVNQFYEGPSFNEDLSFTQGEITRKRTSHHNVSFYLSTNEPNLEKGTSEQNEAKVNRDGEGSIFFKTSTTKGLCEQNVS